MNIATRATRATWLRWALLLGAVAAVDCADVDGAIVPTVASVVPMRLEGPASAAPDRGLSAPCGPCGRRCHDDMACVADACVPPAGSAPRLLLPSSLGRVTTRRPTLRWIPTAGSTGSLVELCHDRACTRVAQRAERTDDRFRPDEALAPGVYFWRVRARVGTVYSEKSSATWEFVVGPRDTPVDTSYGRLWDLNGDGYSDIYLHMGDERDVGIYFGGPTGVSTRPDLRIPLRRGGLSIRASTAGDLNGDGFADLVVREYAPDALLPQRILLVPGGTAPSLDVTLELRASDPWARSTFVTGDLDVDGYADLLGVDTERDGQPATVRVWFGGPRGIAPDARMLLVGAPASGFASAVAGTADLNGDTLPDLLIGAPAEGAETGQAVAWINGRCAEGALMPVGRGDAPGGRFGASLSLAGDVNGDGLVDPVVAMPFSPRDFDRSAVHVFDGPAEPVTLPRALPFARAQTEGIRITHGGDYDGDGWSDLVLWMHNGTNGPSFLLYRGGPGGLPTQPTRVVQSGDFGSRGSALSVQNAGDTDRDGYDDLLVYLEPGEALVARGGPQGPRVAPTPLLTLP